MSRPFRFFTATLFLALAQTIATGLNAQEDGAGLLRLLENRERLNLEVLQQRLDNVPNLTLEQLEEELKLMQAAHQKSRENWDSVQRARGLQAAAIQAVEIRAADMTLKLYRAALERDAKMADLEERERKAYGNKFEPILSIEVKPRNRSNWRATPEYQQFRREESEINSWFNQKVRDITREAQSGNKEKEGELDRIQREVLWEYNWTSHGARRVLDEIAVKKGERQRQAEEEAADEERRFGLRFFVSQSHFELETGQTADVRFEVYRGLPPYYLQVHEPQHGLRDATIEKPGSTVFPFTFHKAGQYAAHAAVYDNEGTSKQVAITFRVVDKKVKRADSSKDEGGSQPESPSDTTSDKPADQKPEDKPKRDASQTQIPAIRPGTYNARWVGAFYPVPIVPAREHQHTPLVVTIGQDGSIASTVDYQVPEDRLGPRPGPNWTTWFCRINFRLTGRTDFQTGKTEIQISAGKRYSGGMTDNGEYTTTQEFRADLTGWAIPGSKDADLFVSAMGKQMLAVRNNPLIPKIQRDAGGQPAFVSQGFLGLDGVEGSADAGTVELLKFFELQAGRRVDRAGQTIPARMWYLEILDRTEPDDDAPEPVPPGELVAFGVWPLSPVRLTVGQSVTLRAMGVYLENVFETVDLSQKATWRHGSGLVEVRPGTYRATRPGTFQVRTGVQKNGRWMSDLVTIEVSPAAPQP